MGQGQAEVALKLLNDCAREGEWLCLKNLHLVTAWLPTLEKVSEWWCHLRIFLLSSKNVTVGKHLHGPRVSYESVFYSQT